MVALVSVALMLALLWLPARQRAAAPWPFLAVPCVLFALGFPLALDHQRAVELAMLLPLALAAWTWGASAGFGEGLWRFFAGAVALASAVALSQVFGGLEAAAGAVELLPPSLKELGTARLATGRAFGTLPIPGHFAALQAMAVPFLVSWSERSRGLGRLFPLGLLALSLAGCLATRSLLGTGLWVLAAAASIPRLVVRARTLLLAGAGLAILVLAVLLRQDVGRLEPLVLRSVNWKVALWAFSQNPWWGVGLGGVGIASLASPWGEQNITPFAHNTPLQLLAEFGLLGLPFFLVILGSALGLALRLWHHRRSASVALLVPLIHNLFDFSLYEPAVLVPFCLLAGAQSAEPSRPNRLFFPLLSLLLGGATVVAALQGKAQGLAETARQRPAEERLELLLRAASLAPWRLAELLEAAWLAFDARDPRAAGRVEEVLDRRGWVSPRSAAWAQAKALILLVEGHRVEAWAWAREARRRAPFRRDLAELERGCRP